MNSCTRSIVPVRFASFSPIRTVVTAALILACTPALHQAEASPRDAITYDRFLAGQSEFILAERGPAGEELRLRYTAQGDPADPTIVLIHGVPSSSWMYRYVVDLLADEPVYAIAVDNLGYGGSDKPQMSVRAAAEFYAPARQAVRLGELLDELGLNSAVFVVHDVGGPILWELLLRRPGSASGLIVLNTIGAPDGFAPPRAMDNPIVRAGMRIVGFEREATIRSIVCEMVAVPTEIDTPVQLEGYYRPFREGSELPYYAFLTNLDLVRDRLPAYSSLLARLDLPAAVLWGSQDENLLVDPSVDWFAQTLAVPSARSVVVADAKHLVAEEEPAEIAELILSIVGD